MTTRIAICDTIGGLINPKQVVKHGPGRLQGALGPRALSFAPELYYLGFACSTVLVLVYLLEAASHTTIGTVSVIPVLAANVAEPGVFYLLCNHGLYRSGDAGYTWDRIAERLGSTIPAARHRYAEYARWRRLHRFD